MAVVDVQNVKTPYLIENSIKTTRQMLKLRNFIVLGK